MATLVIRHEPQEQGYRFSVQRVTQAGVKAAPSVQLPSPLHQVLEPTQSTLGVELSWYLEQFLEYPFGPNEQRAERVLRALRAWGTHAFECLFDSGQARDFYRDAMRSGHTSLQITIASDDATVLAWPWEALHDPLVGDLAHLCRMDRQLDHVSDPAPLPANLSTDHIRILLVTARPYAKDVSYRSISRPLVELIGERSLPATVTVLRPPTLKQLRTELQNKPGTYHLVHFDGHGQFDHARGELPGQQSPGGPQGRLIFEDDHAGPDAVSGEQLSNLLREHQVPMVVLNACQSGMHASEADDAFASVATSLVRAGVRSVVAMSYSVYVSAARQFLPVFYERLFHTGTIAEATRAGRQALLQQPRRMSSRGPYALHDWIVPVLYEQEPLQLNFSSDAPRATQPVAALPEDARLDRREAPYGLIGRDSAVLELERALRRAPAAVLIHGLGGVGKTTLAHGFIEWLAHTDGLRAGVIWLSFVKIRTAEYVINRLLQAVIGNDALAAPDHAKPRLLAEALRGAGWLVVWDNFESATGPAETAGESPMAPGERERLADLLMQLRGGKSKVLVTSRSDETWLASEACFRIALHGLQGEERWQLADAILNDLGIKPDRRDSAIVDLLNKLEGHPLMMRAMLPRLGTQTAADVLREFDRYVVKADTGDPVGRRLNATLAFVVDALPQASKRLLYPLSLHDGCADADYLARMAKDVEPDVDIDGAVECLQRLQRAGLAHAFGQNVFSLHPALTSYLRSLNDPGGGGLAKMRDWQKAFVSTFAKLADQLASGRLHQQRASFTLFGGCFINAQGLSLELGMTDEYVALLQGLASYAYESGNWPLARKRYEALVQVSQSTGNKHMLSVAYHQLGTLALRERDLGAAEAATRKALVVEHEHADESLIGASYHQRGSLALERNDFEEAERWLDKALEVFERTHNERNAAMTYHQLGTLAMMRGEWDRAEQLLNKSLTVKRTLGDLVGQANSYHQLGRVAEGRGDLEKARTYYHASLDLEKGLGNDAGAAVDYYQLAHVAMQVEDWVSAEADSNRALEITERLGMDHRSAMSYHHLGGIAYGRGDMEAAHAWFSKAIAIFERFGDGTSLCHAWHAVGAVTEARGDDDAAVKAYGIALEYGERFRVTVRTATYSALGALLARQGRIADATRVLVEGLILCNELDDTESAEDLFGRLAAEYDSANPEQREQIERLWSNAGLGDFPRPEEGASE